MHSVHPAGQLELRQPSSLNRREQVTLAKICRPTQVLVVQAVCRDLHTRHTRIAMSPFAGFIKVLRNIRTHSNSSASASSPCLPCLKHPELKPMASMGIASVAVTPCSIDCGFNRTRIAGVLYTMCNAIGPARCLSRRACLHDCLASAWC
jgi:hypothetical protein